MTISLVTPSFNKARYLEATLLSVLNQNCRDIEYGIVDGASSDGSQEILARYRDRLAFLSCEPDQGMYDALIKGFSRTSGDIMGYLGADDLHMPWTLSIVEEIFSAFPDVQWITSMFPLTADSDGRVLRARRLMAPSAASFFRGANLPGFDWWSDNWIQQESTFWRRSLWEQVGGLDGSLRFAGDFDLWCRFMKVSPPLAVATPLAAFRRHSEQISTVLSNTYKAEALAAFRKHGGIPGNRYVSRARALFAKSGLAKTGRMASFNFSENRWQISRA